MTKFSEAQIFFNTILGKLISIFANIMAVLFYETIIIYSTRDVVGFWNSSLYVETGRAKRWGNIVLISLKDCREQTQFH